MEQNPKQRRIKIYPKLKGFKCEQFPNGKKEK
jgi:hypothetical protein